MRSRDKAGGKAGSAQRRKTVTSKRRNAPKAARRRNSLAAATETNVAVLTRERDEALEQQTATSEVLRAISNAPTDAASTLGAIAESVARLLDVTDAEIIMRVEDNLLRCVTKYGPSRNWPVGTTRTLSRDWVTGRSVIDRTAIHVADLQAPECEFSQGVAFARQYGHRTTLAVPLLREGFAMGAILIRRMEVKPFTHRQIELVSSFAAQAVIAIENARLFNEVKAKTRDLTESLQQQTATADVLKIISRSAFDLQAVLDTLVESAVRLSGASWGTIFQQRGGLYHLTADCGYAPELREYGRANPLAPDMGSNVGRTALTAAVVQIPDVLADSEFKALGYQRIGSFRAMLGIPLMRDGKVEGVFSLAKPEPGLFAPRQVALVQTFADQAVIAIQNVRLFGEVQTRNHELAASLVDLRTAQDRLVQTEKLASLGQLTAGIAHEIKNPLNFVNNFSTLSAELVGEMSDALSDIHLDKNKRDELDEIAQMLKDNLDKIVQHGKRADSIVKNMLLHSREGSGECRSADINALVEESLNLAYHGARAEKPGFSVTLKRDLDPDAGEAELYPQEITRALLNLISNGFYAAAQRRSEDGDTFEPVLTATTKNRGRTVEISIRDNGTGIPDEVKEKIFNPFFTTKPSGEGTGLGLSMSHDIIVKQHGGSIDVETKPGLFTEFKIVLPRASQS